MKIEVVAEPESRGAKLVERMTNEMRKKLAANAHKGGWRCMVFQELISRLKEEVSELEDCFRGEAVIDPGNVWPEAADIANYAAMIADNVDSYIKEMKP